MISNIKSNYNFDSADYAYNLEDIVDFKGGKRVKVYIPVIMPEIDTSINKLITKQVYCEGIFVNDTSCKPSVEKKITYDYYIEATISFNSDSKHIVNENGIVPKGTKFRCSFMKGDINKCYIDTDIYDK